MKWHYPDGRGVWQTGTVEKTSDRGGSDVTYFFRGDDGSLTVRSGVSLTDAHAVYGPKPGCPVCEEVAA